MFVRDGEVIPHIRLAQSTMQTDWSSLDLVVFAAGAKTAGGLVCLPTDKVLHEITLAPKGGFWGFTGGWKLIKDPLAGKVAWKIQKYSDYKQ